MDIRGRLDPADLFSVKGLVAVITGGGSGIGLAIAATLFQNGATKIYLLGRRKNVLDDAIASLQAAPTAPKDATSVLSAIPCDVSNQSSVAAAVSQITQDIGYVDVLFNNAGVLGPTNGADLYKATSIDDLRDAMLQGFDGNGWQSALSINAQAVVGVSAAFLSLLEAANVRRGWTKGKVQGNGNPRKQDAAALHKIGAAPDDDRLAQIVTVASVASFMRHCTAGLAYNASKAAAAHISKIMASFLSEWGIRSNLVCPGPYPSEMTKTVHAEFGTSEVPQGRMGRASDLGALILFLVGKGGAYVNGSVQLTDGGRTGVWPATY